MVRAVVFIGGQERWHDLFGAGESICRTLAANGIAATLSQDFGILGESRTDDVDVFLAYTAEKPWSETDLAALHRRLGEGKGFVPIHAANVIASPDEEGYAAVVGSRFLGHPPFCRFTVQLSGDHPVTAGLQPFTIDDELYLTEWVGEPGEVLAWAEHEGTRQPMLYTRRHGDGRICYIALGHDGRAWHHPAFRELLVQATLWAAGRR